MFVYWLTLPPPPPLNKEHIKELTKNASAALYITELCTLDANNSLQARIETALHLLGET